MREKPRQLYKSETKKAYQKKVENILAAEDKSLAEKISALESVKDAARQKMQKVTDTRGSINAKHEEFEKMDALTEKRRQDYDEALQVLDYKEQQLFDTMKLAEQTSRKLRSEAKSAEASSQAGASSSELAA